MQMQQQLQQATMELEAMKQDRTVDWEKIKIDKYKAETERIRALSDHEVDAQQLQMNAIAKILDVDQKEQAMQSKESNVNACTQP